MRFFHSILRLIGILTVGTFLGIANGQTSADPAAAAAAVVRQALPPELTSMLPVGREFLGVSIPSYGDEELQSVLKADSIMRVDDQFLDLENLIIYVYNAAGEKETTISMDAAAYDLTIGELTSKTPATVEQAQFTMTGDKMIFDTNSQNSRLIGNVVVIVPDASNLVSDFGLPISGSSKEKSSDGQ